MEVDFWQKAVFLTYWGNHVAFVFQICYCGVSQWLICRYWKILVSLDKSTWPWCVLLNFFVVGFGLLVFYGGYCVYVHQCYWTVITFDIVVSFLSFDIKVMVVFRLSLEVFLPATFGIVSNICVNSSLNWLNSPVNPSCPGFLFFWGVVKLLILFHC